MFGCCKTFSGKYIFSGNANFRKRKMFSYVWLHFKKFSGKYFLVFGKEEGKHKSENTKTQPRKKDHQRSQHKIAITARSRIAIDGARSRSGSRSTARDRDHGAIVIRDRNHGIAMAPDRDRRRDRDLAVDRAVGLELELAIDRKSVV